MDNFDEIRTISSKCKLLYVEDNKMVRDVTLSFLEEYFDAIIVADDGEDGLLKFHNNEIDFIITDINMPKLNGLEMAKKIKAINQELPILLLSAHNDTEYFMDSIKLGIEGYLQKPIDLEQFETILYKTVKNIQMRKEHEEYKLSLEMKVKEQLNELRVKDVLIARQAKMAAMGEMIDIIAHQWKQPLNNIKMWSELLSIYKTPDEMIEYKYIEEYREKLSSKLEHLLDTLDEFRNFFRPNYNIKVLSLQSILQSITILLKDELIQNTVNVSIQCDNSLYIEANENDIKHLFINLIKNSIEEMVKSDIKYNQREISIVCEGCDERVIIKVSDSGKGIPKEILPYLFDLNFTTKGEIGGSGVGLYMCKQIVQKYDGEMSATNNVGDTNGALFVIEFLKKGAK